MHPDADVFLLDPDNEQFALGNSRRLPIGGQGCLLLILGIFVLAGLLIGGAVLREWAHFAMLGLSGAETQGTVLGHEVEYDEGAICTVTYRCIVDDLSYVVKESVGEGTYDALEEG